MIVALALIVLLIPAAVAPLLAEAAPDSLH